jgi:hypothetical protein
MNRTTSACWLAAMVMAGCSSDADLGSRTGGEGGDGADSLPLLGAGGWGGYAGNPRGCEERADPFDAVEVWTGYIQGPTAFPSDQITLRFSAVDAGAVAGEVMFGQGGNPGYTVPDEARISAGGYTAGAVKPGFPYTMLGGTRSGDRIEFQFSAAEDWCAWCGEQASFADPAFGYACVPYSSGTVACNPTDGCIGTDPATGTQVRWTFTLDFLCAGAGICRCDATGCGAPGTRGAYTGSNTFDLTIDDPTHATGLLDSSPVRFDIAPGP